MAHQFQHIVHALSTDYGLLARFLREPEPVLQSFALTEEERDILLAMREEALDTAAVALKAEGPFPGWQGMELAEGPFPGWQGVELAEGPFPGWQGAEPDLATSSL